MTSGVCLLRSTSASDRRRSISNCARRSAEEADRRCWMSSSEGTLGRSSTLPATWVKRGGLAPSKLASRARALRCSLCACASSTRTPASATRALVSSTGDTLPAVTRLATASVACLARSTLSWAKAVRSWAASASKKAATTAARISTRRVFSSSTATSRPRSAAAMRAARLPPSSMGRLIWTLCVRVGVRWSSSEYASSGLGRTRP